MADINFIQKNAMSASALIKMQGAGIDLIKNPKTGKNFFVCGEVTGYASAKAVAVLTDGNLSDAEAIGKLRFAEVATEGSDNYVPCLMVVATNNVVASRGKSVLANL